MSSPTNNQRFQETPELKEKRLRKHYLRAVKIHRENGGWVRQQWKQGVRKEDIPDLGEYTGITTQLHMNGWNLNAKNLDTFDEDVLESIGVTRVCDEEDEDDGGMMRTMRGDIDWAAEEEE